MTNEQFALLDRAEQYFRGIFKDDVAEAIAALRTRNLYLEHVRTALKLLADDSVRLEVSRDSLDASTHSEKHWIVGEVSQVVLKRGGSRG